MKVLQQSSFCTFGRFSFGSRGVKESYFGCLGYGKADPEHSHGLAVENFLDFYILRSFFLGIMGFQPSFLLLHPSFLEVKPQRKEQYLYPHILLSGS